MVFDTADFPTKLLNHSMLFANCIYFHIFLLVTISGNPIIACLLCILGLFRFVLFGDSCDFHYSNGNQSF